MIYYPLHVIPDAGRRMNIKVPPAFFLSPSPQLAVRIGIGFTCLTLLLGVGLFFMVNIGTVYLVLVLAAGLYALVCGLRLSKDSLNRNKGLKAFTSMSVFRLIISAAILISIF